MKKYLKESFLGKPFLTILLLMVFSLSNSYSQVYEPTYHVTGFTIGTVTSTSIQLNWTGSVGFKLPSSYVILAKKGAGSYASVSDGSDVSDDSDWSNNNAAINIAHSVGANTYTFSSLTPNTSYDFIIYPYNGTGATIDYKTDPTIPTLTQATDPTAATIVLSDNTINEGSESSGVITVTVSNDTYINPADGADWTVTNLPDGVTKGAVNYVDPTHVTIGLSGDRSVDYDNSITNVTVSCTADALTLNSVTGASASTGVTLVANNDGESLAISGGPYTEGSEDGQTVTVTLTGGTFASSLTAGNWSLNNAPVGVGVLSVVPVDATHITLTFNGDRTTDYDANITTMTVTAGATEIDDSNTGVTSSTGVTFTAITETAAITHAGLTEANLNTAVVTYNLTNETFADATLSDGNFTLNAPSGTTVNSVAWVSSTQATVTLAFDGTDFDGNFTTFNITCDAVEFTGSGNITSDDLTITALTESAAITHAGLTEANLNTAIVTYTLTNETFADGSLLTGSFTLGNAPTGTTVNSVGYSSSTVATVTLAFNGTDFDSDVTTFNITCAAVELSRAANITSNNLTITATDETAAITYGGGLTEANLNTAGVTLTLTNETFADNSYDPANFTLNAPTGTTVTAVNYVSSTQVTVILAFDGTDFDANFTTFHITVAAVELTGTGNITSNDLTITALVESAAIAHAGLTEANLNTAVVTYTLTNETFDDITLVKTNFTLNNEPTGTTIASVGYSSSTEATVTLAFDGTDFDSDVTTFNITCAAVELSRAANITSNNLTITAIDETVINVSTTSLTHFGNVQTGNNSSEQSFTVAGVDLNTDITITPPTGFEISETTGPFSSANPITLTPTGGTVSTTTIYVRFSPTVAGEASGNITNTSTGATAKNVAVAGTGTTAGAASNVAITEVVDYNGSDNLDFIEIYNSGNASAYINGYVLTERYEAGTSTTSRSIILNASTQGNTGGSNYLTLEQGEYAIICKGTASNFRSTYTSIGNNVAIFSNSTLPGIDGNERYQLDGTAKAILDNYGDWDDGGVFSLTPDKSYERITTSSTGELESDWTRTTSASYEPTPAGTNNNPLPIELVSFKAIVVGDIINLEWITASETNNDYFTVEKSIDAEYFDILTNIVGAGNSNNFVYYSTKDKNPIEGINYYRLKQTDFDGEFSYSDIIFVNKNKNTIVFEQPYKSGSSLQTFLYNQTGKTLNVEIINLLGQVIYREEIKPQTDTHFISLNINKFTKGIYLLRISNETDFLVKRFLN